MCECVCERTEAARVKSSMGRAASTQIYGQSVYLALCCADMLRSRLFHGPPYLNHALLPLLPLPSDHTLPQESLQDNNREGLTQAREEGTKCTEDKKKRRISTRLSYKKVKTNSISVIQLYLSYLSQTLSCSSVICCLWVL